MGGKARYARHRARDLRREAEQHVAVDDIEDRYAGGGRLDRRGRDADPDLPLARGMGEGELLERRANRKLHRPAPMVRNGARPSGADARSTFAAGDDPLPLKIIQLVYYYPIRDQKN